jgi:hypothetical protein
VGKEAPHFEFHDQHEPGSMIPIASRQPSTRYPVAELVLKCVFLHVAMLPPMLVNSISLQIIAEQNVVRNG